MSDPLITLYVPGGRPELIEKAAKYNPDALIIDLEDTVPPPLKAETRTNIAKLIPDLKSPALVRVNNDPDYLDDDLTQIASDKIIGIVLPMIDNAETVRHVDAKLAEAEQAKGLREGTVKIILQIESALGVMRTYELATASSRVISVTFGSAEDGDLQRDLQASWSADGPELLYARSRVLLEARAAKLPFVLDGAFSDIKNLDSFRRDCEISKRLGYDGRTLIHPGQFEIAREVYSLNESQANHYREVVEAFEAAEKRGEAAIQVGGKLIDYAMYKQAKAALARA